MGVATHDQVHGAGIESPGEVDDLAVTGGGCEGRRRTVTVAEPTDMRHDDHVVACAPFPKASPRTFRGEVVSGVAGRASPMTATREPPRWITVTGSAQSRRAVP